MVERASSFVLPGGRVLDAARLVDIKAVTFPTPAAADAVGLPGVAESAGRPADPRVLTAWLRVASGRATDADALFMAQQDRMVELLHQGASVADAKTEARREFRWAMQSPDVDQDLIDAFVDGHGLIATGSAHASVENEHNRVAVAAVDARTNGARGLLSNTQWHHSNEQSRADAFTATDPATRAAAHQAHAANRQALAEAISRIGEPIVAVIIDELSQTGSENFSLPTVQQVADGVGALAGRAVPNFGNRAEAGASISNNLPAAVEASGRSGSEILAELLLRDASGSQPHPGALRFEARRDEVHRMRNRVRGWVNAQVVTERARLDAMTGRSFGIGQLVAVANELGIRGDAEAMQALFSGTDSGIAVRVGGPNAQANFDVASNGELVDTKSGYELPTIDTNGRIEFNEHFTQRLGDEAARQVEALDDAMTQLADAAAQTARSEARAAGDTQAEADVLAEQARSDALAQRPPIVWTMSNDLAAEAARNLMSDRGLPIEIRTQDEHAARTATSRAIAANVNHQRSRAHAIEEVAARMGLDPASIEAVLNTPELAARDGANSILDAVLAADPEADSAVDTNTAQRAAEYHARAKEVVAEVVQTWMSNGLDPVDLGAGDSAGRRSALMQAAAADPRVVSVVVGDITSGRSNLSHAALARVAGALDVAPASTNPTRADLRAAIDAAFALPTDPERRLELFGALTEAMRADQTRGAARSVETLIDIDIARAAYASSILTDDLGPGAPAVTAPGASGTASAIEGSRFSGAERWFAHPKSVTRAIRAAFRATDAESNSRLAYFSGTREITQIDDASYLVTTEKGAQFAVEVRAGDLRGAADTTPVARYEMAGEVDLQGGSVPTFTVEVSDRARVRDVTRALGHEIAEISARLEGRSGTMDMLRPGVTTDEPLTRELLSPHDRGRLAELRYLSVESTSGGWLQRRGAERELRALVLHLGLDLSVDGPTAELDVAAMSYEQIADRLTALDRDTSLDASPFGQRLAAVPPELRPHVILANVGADAVGVPDGLPGYRTLLARNLIAQLGGGAASAGAIVLSSGPTAMALVRGGATMAIRTVTSFTGAANERAHLRRVARLEAISKSLAVGTGNAHDRAARELDRNGQAVLRNVSRPPELTSDQPAATNDPLLQKERELASFASTTQRYGANNAIETALTHAADRLAGAISSQAATFLDRSVIGADAGAIGALASVLAEWQLAKKNLQAKSVRSAALSQIENDMAQSIADLLMVSALEIEAALDQRADVIRQRGGADPNGESEPGAVARPAPQDPTVPPVPNVVEQLASTIDRALATLAPPADVQSELAELVTAAEKSRDRWFELHRSRRTPAQIALEQFLTAHQLAPDLTTERTSDDTQAHLWYLRLTALDDSELAGRVMQLLDVPSGVADLRTLLGKGILGTGTPTGLSVGAFGVMTGSGPVEVIVEGGLTVVVSGTIAGSAEFATLRGAERKQERDNPLRADITNSDLAKYGAPLQTLQNIVNALAQRDDPTAEQVTSTDQQRLDVLRDRFGRPDDAAVHPNRPTSHLAYGSRFSVSGLVAAATQALGITTPAAAVGTAGATAATATGEGLLKSETEIAKARRDLFLRILSEDARRATIDTHPTTPTPHHDDAANQTHSPHGTEDINSAKTDLTHITEYATAIESTAGQLTSRILTNPDLATRAGPDLTLATEYATAARRAADTANALLTQADAHPNNAETLADSRRMLALASDYLAVADNALTRARTAINPPASDTDNDNDSATSPPPPPSPDQNPNSRAGTTAAAATATVATAAAATGWETIRRLSRPTGWRREPEVDPFDPMDPTPPPQAVPPTPAAPALPETPEPAAPPSDPTPAPDQTRRHDAPPDTPPAATPSPEPRPNEPDPQPPGPPERCPHPHADTDEPCGPVGQRAVAVAVRAAIRAVNWLAARVAILDRNAIRLWLPDGTRLDLTFNTGDVPDDGGIAVDRDGNTLSITIDTDALAVDIAVDVSAGIAALYSATATDPSAAPVLDPATTPVPETQLSLDDQQAIAALREMTWQLDHGCPGGRDLTAAALNETIDDLGLDADQPQSTERRAYLPEDLADDLARLVPDWDNPDPHAPELAPDRPAEPAPSADDFWDVVDQINQHTDWTDTTDTPTRH
ncbi:hypothetical protein [Epidermidibacterium keratini]